MQREIKTWNWHKDEYKISYQRNQESIYCKNCMIAKNFMAFVG